VDSWFQKYSCFRYWSRIELDIILIFSTIAIGEKNNGLEICISRPFSALVEGIGQSSNFHTDIEAVVNAKILLK